MSKILLRITGVLLILHGFTAFVAARFLPTSAIGDRLLFAQHGFTFIFLALLNLVIWQSPRSSGWPRWALHACNLSFSIFYVAISLRNPEPPNWVSTALVTALFLMGLVFDRTAKPPVVVPTTD
jgi:peptidoglycan/LPS O-acetylase OafA/YrhL